MSPGLRAFYGAACGALAVLFAHPASRPFLTLSLSHWGQSAAFKRSSLLLQNQTQLQTPKDLIEASLWMEAGCRSLTQHKARISDLRLLVTVARHASASDLDNAYWPQMEAVFLSAASRLANSSDLSRAQFRKEALDAWQRASTLARWNDYQTQRLQMLQKQLSEEFKAQMAWQYAAVYPERSTEQAFEIEGCARDFISNADMKTPDSMRLRYATLLNGKLLREGAKSIEALKIGANVVESAAYTKDLPQQYQRKSEMWRRTWLRNTFKNHLHNYEATINADRIFRSNEAWLALTDPQQFDWQSNELAAFALLTATIPGALIAVAIFGGFLWFISFAFQSKPVLLKVVEAPIAPAIGLVLAILLFYATHLPLASIAVVACFSFLAFTPLHERTHAPQQLGTAFEIIVFALSVLLAIFGMAFIVGVSTPGIETLPSLNLPKEFYGGSTLFMGLVGIVLGLLTLAAPAWAMSKRLATPFVIMLTLRQFGRVLFLGAIALIIVVTPLAVIADHALSTQLQQIVQNEPLHYLRP